MEHFLFDLAPVEQGNARKEQSATKVLTLSFRSYHAQFHECCVPNALAALAGFPRNLVVYRFP